MSYSCPLAVTFLFVILCQSWGFSPNNVNAAFSKGTQETNASSATNRADALSKCGQTGQCCGAQEVEQICRNATQAARDEQHTKLRLTVQLDACSTAADLRYVTEVFNAKNSFFHVTLEDTPVPQSALDINSTKVTSPRAQARWSDVSSTGTDNLDNLDKVFGSAFLLFYRVDIFSKSKQQVPTTWDELLEVAEKLNGTDMDGKSGGEYAVCFSGGLHCHAHYVLMSMLGPMVQGGGEGTRGVVFDPDSMKALVKNAAMRKALDVYRRLVRFTDPGSLEACSAYDERMGTSKCAMSINRASQYVLARFGRNEISGVMRTASLPGSQQILDRRSGELVPCTTSTCPHATFTGPDNSTLLNRAPLFTPWRRVIIRPPKSITDVPNRVAVSSLNEFFDRAIFESYTAPALIAIGQHVPGPTVLTPVNPPPSTRASNRANSTEVSPSAQAALSKALSQEGITLEALGVKLLKLASSVDESQAALNLDESLAPKMDLPAVESMGFDLADGVEFLQRAEADASHKNRVMDLMVPGASYIRLVLAEGAVNATAPGADLDQIMETMETKVGWVVAEFPNTSTLQQIYLTSLGLGFVNPGSPPAIVTVNRTLFEEENDTDDSWTGGVIAAVVLSSVAFVVLLVGTILLVKQSRTKVMMLLGTVAPPGQGPSTTLLVTDIQNSTVMWEQLPGELMADVMRVHHRTLRGLLDKHGGYESATEGDSFIIAFHNPLAALSYAIEAQLELLNAEWPQQLLSSYPEAALVRAEVMSDADEAKLSATTRYLQGASSNLRDPKRSRRLGMLASFRTMMKNVSATYGSAAASSWRCCGRRGRKQDGRVLSAMSTSRTMTRAMTRMVSRVRSKEIPEVDVQQAGSNSEWELDPSEAHLVKDVNEGCTLGQSLEKAWICTSCPDVEAGPTSRGVPIWRGLRVRIGIHTCWEEQMLITNNRTSRRTQYSGPFANTAKYVSDVGHGGQILISHTAFCAMSLTHREKVGVMFMGEHVLASDLPQMPLYQVPVPGLEPRLCCFPPLRTKSQLAPGVLDAPVGVVTVVFMNAIGVSTLLAWNAEVTRAAITVYHSTVSRLLPKYGGHKVEMADGLCLIAFQRPEDAIAWALESHANLLEAPWPAELLKHELCEPISTMLAISLPDGGVDTVSKVHSVGLRLKVGVATGAVVDSVQASTGAMGYRGKVMNRAARVCSAATTGQVLVMPDCWEAAKGAELVRAEAITAALAGAFTLKGIEESVDLQAVTYTTAKGNPEELKAIRSAPNPVHLSMQQESDDDEPLPDQSTRVLRPSVTWAPGKLGNPSPFSSPPLAPLREAHGSGARSPETVSPQPLPPSNVLPDPSSDNDPALLPRSSNTI